MLFDLRSGGRRRTVKIVYLGLALLMFVGFVGFSIGSSGLSGGIVDAITGNGTSGGGDTAASERLTTQVQTADAKTKAAPTDPAAWAALAQARLRLAAVGDNFDSAAERLHRRRQAPARRRRHRLGQVPRARTRQARRAPRPPDDPGLPLARASPTRPSPPRRSSPRSTRPSRPSTNLALLAYQAGQTRKGDLAAAKAVDLAPKDEQEGPQDPARLGQVPGRRSSRSSRPQPTADARPSASTPRRYPLRPRPCSSTGRAADS